MPDEDRYTYAEGLRRGGYLVTVNAGSAHYDRALDILDDDGTIDIGEREQSWRSEGWSGYTGASGSTGLGTGTAGSTGGLTGTGAGLGGVTANRSTTMSGTGRDEEVIPVAEEQLRVGKRDVSHGRVRVRSYVVETPVSEQVSLREENVSIERRPVDRPLAAGDRLFEDRTIEVEERAEEAVVAKEARVREELVVNKQVGERTETVTDTVRHTEVDVEDDRTRHDAHRLHDGHVAHSVTSFRWGSGPTACSPIFYVFERQHLLHWPITKRANTRPERKSISQRASVRSACLTCRSPRLSSRLTETISAPAGREIRPVTASAGNSAALIAS